jgi:hypothetical protein
VVTHRVGSNPTLGTKYKGVIPPNPFDILRMSKTFDLILDLIKRRNVVVSEHGYDELAEDDIFIGDILRGASEGTIIEEYPDYPKGPCALVLQRDSQAKPIHVVWGIPKGASSPAVLVTGYRPDPERWSDDFLRRKQ